MEKTFKLEGHINLFICFLVGILFMFVPVNQMIFESFEGLVSGALYIFGFATTVISGLVIVFKTIFRFFYN
jgi:hypothetical protein